MKATVGELWKLIHADKSPQMNMELVHELAPERGEKYKVLTVSGWKPTFIGADGWLGCDDEAVVEVAEMRVGYIAQWIKGLDRERFIYVNMPNMKGGTCSRGTAFTVGVERVYSDTPREELDSILREGHKKFIEVWDAWHAVPR